MAPDITIHPTRPDHPLVAAMLADLDRYLMSLYAPEENHILGAPALLAPDVDFLAAWLGGEAVGCGAMRRMPGDGCTPGQRYGEIKRMYVTPKLRGQRVAELLLIELEGTLRSEGIGAAMLETGNKQHEAVRLYERCGYAKRAIFGAYSENGMSVFDAKAL